MLIEDSSLKVIRARGSLLKAERTLSRERTLVRKIDARNKIELGGLVIKGGLDKETKAVILGAIIAARKEIAKEPAYRELLKSLGEESFMGYKNVSS